MIEVIEKTVINIVDPIFFPRVHALNKNKSRRIQSIDLLRGVVMIIMALDHVRDYFHRDAFLYEPTDLSKTSVVLFFTRWITHYCAPVFVFLAGISAYLYGSKRTKKQLSRYLFTRGMWLIFAELFIISFGRTFNPGFPFVHLQVIWAIGAGMLVLSVLVYLNRRVILISGMLLVAGHNLLDQIRLPGNFLWALLHQPGDFTIGGFAVFVHYPLMPWIGLIATGYSIGFLFSPDFAPEKRKQILLNLGIGLIAIFVLLRSGNFYGDAAPWSVQKNAVFSILSFLNVTKYPPSFLYICITIGPALIFLGLSERPLNRIRSKISVFGRVPFFYYVLHIYVIHLFALLAAILTGYSWTTMILSTRVNRVPELKGYGFNLFTVYLVWAALILLLYPFCKWFDRYKRTHQSRKKWLSYL